jgi:hypothetical protein
VYHDEMLARGWPDQQLQLVTNIPGIDYTMAQG